MRQLNLQILICANLIQHFSCRQRCYCSLSWVPIVYWYKWVTQHQRYPHDTPFQRQLESDGNLSESSPCRVSELVYVFNLHGTRSAILKLRRDPSFNSDDLNWEWLWTLYPAKAVQFSKLTGAISTTLQALAIFPFEPRLRSLYCSCFLFLYWWRRYNFDPGLSHLWLSRGPGPTPKCPCSDQLEKYPHRTLILNPEQTRIPAMEDKMTGVDQMNARERS